MAQVNSTFNTFSNTNVDNTVSTTMGALILSIVFLLGFPGNLFVIWSILARAKRHSVTTLIILNLAIADGSLMGLTPFFIVYLVSKDWLFGLAMCKILFYLCLLNMYASIQLIMLMSVYRMLAVLWPQRFTRFSGRKTVTRVVVVVWALMMVASIPAIVFRRVGKKNNSTKMVCDSVHAGDDQSQRLTVTTVNTVNTVKTVVIQYTLELILGFLIPYGVIVFCYIRILRRIRQTRFGRRIRSENLILAIVVMFCIFWLPYHIINMVQVTWALCPDGKVKDILDKIWQSSRVVTSSIAFFSSSANPVLYFFAGKSYIRREGMAFMARLFEGTGLDSMSRKSRQNSQNSRDRDKEAEVITLKE